MTRRHIHVLYEVDHEGRPHSSPYVQLLRPLSHPLLHDVIELTSSPMYSGQRVDAVILNRLWGPHMNRAVADDLLASVRRAGAQLIYALDDNLLDMRADGGDWPTIELVAVVEYLLEAADGVLVSTNRLRERIVGYNANIAVVPNALDERLIVGGGVPFMGSPFGETHRPVVIGYMGTVTHDADLDLVLPALDTVFSHHPNSVRLEIVGVTERTQTGAELGHLPIRFLSPPPDEREYPLFMTWFTSQVHWDIAIAPLQDTPFTRCKSDVKFLDYAAVGAAGIFSAVPAYARTIRHMETGWLAENTTAAWIEAIERLIADHVLRQQMALNATTYLHAERTLRTRAPDWAAAIATLLGG